MSRLIDDLQTTCHEGKQAGLRAEVLKIRLKERLQYYILDYIYNSDAYNHLVMYGGTSLRICFNLNRMSEDVDFETTKPFDKKKFARDVSDHFIKKIQHTNLTVHVPGQKINRVELRFPVLNALGLSLHTAENLIVKVEVNSVNHVYATGFKTVAEGNFGFVIRHYTLPVLMAGKILACLDRVWEKSGVQIKGRDYYDLIWYMQQGVMPDKDYLADHGYSVHEAFARLKQKAKGVKPRDLLADLLPLFENPDFSKNWSESFQAQFETLKARYEPVD